MQAWLQGIPSEAITLWAIWVDVTATLSIMAGIAGNALPVEVRVA
jgi:hypothetical protein